MRIINIVDNVSELNYGIWHAAIVNASHLKKSGYKVELWSPETELEIPADVSSVQLSDTSLATLRRIIEQRDLNANSDVVITHGVWQFPTRWGNYLKTQGFKWVYVPQGMLEPWPLKQKWLKKKLYFLLAEKRMARKADLIRAVSTPELNNLQKTFLGKQIVFIPNGVKMPSDQIHEKDFRGRRIFLFMSRLHHKKNVVALVEAWLASTLNGNPEALLIIAGPDQGELPKLRELMAKAKNIEYVGSVFGETKANLLQTSHFFILPSFSEGLPSALLEAMSSGLIPIITDGCNLPDVASNKLGWNIGTDIQSIIGGLQEGLAIPQEDVQELSLKNSSFIKEKFSVEAITRIQLKKYLNPG